jgi:hypothetical protein
MSLLSRASFVSLAAPTKRHPATSVVSEQLIVFLLASEAPYRPHLI